MVGLKSNTSSYGHNYIQNKTIIITKLSPRLSIYFSNKNAIQKRGNKLQNMNPIPNLKMLRLQHNYKQEYIAQVIGMTQPAYSKLESGLRKLNVYDIRNLCALYMVSSDELLSSQPIELKSKKTEMVN